MKDIEMLIRQICTEDHTEYKDKIIAVVHAKGNSTRVPSKNLRILGDKPLFCHAIVNAKHSSLVDEVVIDSDSEEILRIGTEYGAVPLRRPRELATNMATGDDLAYWQASNYPLSHIILQVIPTAPFLRPESIDRAIQILLDNPHTDSVVGVYEEALYTWTDGRPDYYLADGSIPNSFAMKKTVYETTGLYVNYTRAVLETRRRLNPDNCMACSLSRVEEVDINTPEDFWFADIVWQGLHVKSLSGENWGGTEPIETVSACAHENADAGMTVWTDEVASYSIIAGLYLLLITVFMSFLKEEKMA